ncbi:ABC transporter ATP-binding protein/permease [Aldersonia sp. NBC_00410]|uniref:ABC transporter ATP-binding protein n=1 Tax=Aldersonia sp. NBC_00410 TaxID=2975954 RepID=UPI00225C16D1|nr:ABC transporter ATP-binding protein [Aldersonia sp. NBC_00410]MCX5044169.1 ABC transporter ATP-binding protein/permease [Aldersonia sp. NBC_00410]
MTMRSGLGVALGHDGLDSIGTRKILRSAVRVMLRGSRGYPIATPVSFVAGMVNGATMVLSAIAIGRATDHLILPVFTGEQVPARTWLLTAAAILGVSLLRVVTIVTRSLSAAVVQFGEQANTRRALVNQFGRLDVRWHRRHSAGQLLSNTVSDVDAQWFPMQFFAFAAGSVFMLLVAVVNIVRADRYLAVVAVAMVTAILVANLCFQRVMSPRARAAQRARADLSSVAFEAIEGEQVVRTLGISADETARFAQAAQHVRGNNTRMAYASAAFDPIVELTPTATVLVVLAVGAQRVSSGDLTVGILVEAIYLFLTMALPLNIIGRFLGVVPLAVVGQHRTKQVLESTQFAVAGTAELAGRAPIAVRIEAVTYRHGDPATPGPPFGPIDLMIDAGDVVAVVGTTGSGKSTLVRLLARTVDPDEGIVAYDGVDVRTLARGAVESRVAVVGQHTFLFDDTVRANVTVGRDLDDDAVWRALRLAAADGFVHRNPAGLNARVGKLGTALSGGQRQRIALARALAGSPSLLILDDATSALDPSVERTVLENIRSEFVAAGGPQRRCTIVITAARKTSVTLADRVVLLDGGRIAATGTHAELLDRDTRYRAIVEAYGSPIETGTAIPVSGGGR